MTTVERWVAITTLSANSGTNPVGIVACSVAGAAILNVELLGLIVVRDRLVFWFSFQFQSVHYELSPLLTIRPVVPTI